MVPSIVNESGRPTRSTDFLVPLTPTGRHLQSPSCVGTIQTHKTRRIID
jgi:hypothetical protein